MVRAYRNLEDPEDIMSLSNGPKFTSTSFHNRSALPNLNANGHQSWTLYNTNLSTVHDFPFTSGFGYYYNTNGSANLPSKFMNLPIEVSYNRDMTIELQNLEDIQATFNQRGVNFVNNAGPNTGYVASNYLQNFMFNVNTHKPNIYLFSRFFQRTRPTDNDTSYYHLQIVKMSDLNANIRTATPFPNHPQKVPVPTDDSYALLDCSSLSNASPSELQVLARHLNDLDCHYVAPSNNFWFYIVDPSNTMSGTFTYHNTTTPAISWHTGVSAPLIARLLDDTLTRQDIRWALWFTSLPLPRFLSSSDLTLNATNAAKTKLTPLVWRTDNKQAYMKWLAKKGVEHNEYTLSNMIANPTRAMELIRDVRICKTFFYQVVTYMVKMSVAVDSNTLMDATRIRNLIQGNIDGIDALYSTTLAETSTHYTNWFAWIPYELAHAVNASVKLDSPRWRVSKSGYKIADTVKRSRSIMFDPTATGQIDRNYYNLNDTDTNTNPLPVTSQLSASKQLTINALPVSLYWEAVRFPVFTTTFDESSLVSDEYLEEHAYFPEVDLEQSWN